MLGGACVTEEVWPGQRVSRASYVVSMLQPKVVSDLRLHDFGYEAMPLDPSFATFAADGRPIFFFNDDARARRPTRALLASKDADAYPGFEDAARAVGRLPAPAAAPPAAGARLQAARRPALAPARGRPRGGADAARHARALPRDDDVRRRPARRLVRDRRDQGRDRLHRRGRRLGRAAHARHRLQPAPSRARRAERRAGRVGPREGRDGRHQPGAGTQRRGARSHDPHGRARCARSTSATVAPPASRSRAARRSRAPLVVSGAHPRTTVLDLAAPSTSRTRSATTCAATAAAAAR